VAKAGRYDAFGRAHVVGSWKSQDSGAALVAAPRGDDRGGQTPRSPIGTVITHRIREVFSAVFGRDARSLGPEVVYDVRHNTAKLERHVVAMETGSALLVGTAHAVAGTCGSTAHGSGRTMSRTQAKRRVCGERLIQDMAQRGIIVRAASKSGVAEEAGFAYQDLAAVVDTLRRLDLSGPVASLTSIGNIEG